jgi:hypothetical protein
MRIQLVRNRSLLITVLVVAAAFSVHGTALQSHRSDLDVISSIRELPMEYNLPVVRRLGCPPHGEDGGRAHFDYCGSDVLEPLFRTLDIRYGCRVTRISLVGRSYSDRSLERLGELVALRELRMRDTRVTGEAIVQLKERLPNLTVVRELE